MLILTRRRNESVRVGDVIVKVLGVETRDPQTQQLLAEPRVKLGIDAPADTKIVRTELEDYAKGKTWSFGRV